MGYRSTRLGINIVWLAILLGNFYHDAVKLPCRPWLHISSDIVFIILVSVILWKTFKEKPVASASYDPPLFFRN